MKTKLTLFVAVFAVALFGTGCASTEPAFVSDGLVAYYPFNTTLKDSSGNELNGLIRSKAKYTENAEGKPMSAIWLALGSYIDAPLSPSLVAEQKDFSIALWFKTSQKDADGVLVESGRQGNGRGEYQIALSRNQLYVMAGLGGARQTQCTALAYRQLIKPNEWAHVAMVIDRKSGFLRGYLNGKSAHFDGPPKLPKGRLNQPNNSETYIRMGAIDNHHHCFEGELDEVRFYNRALSAEEVKALYNLEKPKGK